MFSPFDMSFIAPLTILWAATAHGQTLYDEIRASPGYSDLTTCQQRCIAGWLTSDIRSDYTSWASRSNCETKTCICAPETQTEAEKRIVDCQNNLFSSCQQSVEHDGAIRWVVAYCGWSPGSAPPTPSSTSTSTSTSTVLHISTALRWLTV